MRFISEGLGIEARHQRSARYWAPHLSLSRSFITEALAALQPRSVTVLGAGSLLDFPPAAAVINAVPTLSDILFVDGNPLACGAYRGFAHELRTLRGTGTAPAVRWLIGDVEKLPEQELGADVVISLNMISQLSHMGSSSPEPAQKHLELLGKIAERCVVLLGDRFWYQYHPAVAEWEAEPACPEIVSDSTDWSAIRGFVETKRSGWLWHVAPYGIEERDCGMIHDVGAQVFVRAQS